ncbi:MAG: type secretion pathway protein XcpS [Oscillospiraceae bacterium]|nr:type secretion pathway protein XcpS [Oscillospiraceae bacterium]
MPHYKYTAKNVSGKTFKGSLIAQDESHLMTVLREKQLFLVQSKEIKKEDSRKKLKPMEVSDFSRQIGSMLSSGVSLTRAMNIIMNRDHSKKLKGIYADIYRSLQNGLVLSEALKELGGVFPELFINMIEAGELSGKMDDAAIKMAEYYQKEHQLNSKISGAMTYPAVLSCVIVVVVLVIFVVVLPNFFAAFKGMTLPVPTRVMLAISNGMIHYWYLILGGVLLIATMVGTLMQRESFRNKLDKLKLNIPKIGKLLKIIYTARFARTMSSLYASGIPIISILQISRITIGNRFISMQFDEVILLVKNGTSLSQAIKTVKGFDIKLSSRILIVEETGRLESMLSSVAESFDYEAESSSKRLVTLLEPMMILFMAVIVLFIMLSVLMPILKIYQNIG